MPHVFCSGFPHERPWGQLEPPASSLACLWGRGVCLLPGAQVPLALATAMLLARSFLLVLLLLAMPAPTHTWSRPLWYQVGLDLQPWGCQPDSMESCRESLGCPGHLMGLGENYVYPVAGVTATTTMMLMIAHVVQRRWRLRATKFEHPQVTTDPPGLWKQRTPISDRTLLLGVLHVLDALLVHIEGHLQSLATQQRTQIKGTPTQSG
ncbi:transmembrane protein 89 [Equus asinus]|uniref:Transmembrane protein 89 n=3 Tax=Equus TaxID=9789 RepID=A0A9L0JVN3_EQUAS|nr:transmembrane protein 89 [Equus caballus]XP_008526108.1 PREDICTED: transmembrane protein 89 [Equus przewalskii]XP_014695828.1 transmembrane protein 89 [Equus asinus]